MSIKTDIDIFKAKRGLNKAKKEALEKKKLEAKIAKRKRELQAQVLRKNQKSELKRLREQSFALSRTGRAFGGAKKVVTSKGAKKTYKAIGLGLASLFDDRPKRRYKKTVKKKRG